MWSAAALLPLFSATRTILNLANSNSAAAVRKQFVRKEEISEHLPQNVLQDAAVMVVRNFFWGIDASDRSKRFC
jgi:hypothetical protein